MPNKRKQGKKSKAVWFTAEEREMIKVIRDSLGLKSDTEAIKRAIEDLAREKGIIK